jgi:hypothetical protein
MLFGLLANPKYRDEIDSALAIVFLLFVVYLLVRLWQAGGDVENRVCEPDVERMQEPLLRG